MRGEPPNHVLMMQLNTSDEALKISVRHKRAEAILRGNPSDDVDFLPNDAPLRSGLDDQKDSSTNFALSLISYEMSYVKEPGGREYPMGRQDNNDHKRVSWNPPRLESP